jgi:hypothetical protein
LRQAEIMVFLSATQAITQLVEQTFQILGRLRTAHQRQKALVGVLARHQNELNSLKNIVKIIKKYEDLQTSSVATELLRLQDTQEKLAKFLTTLDPQSKSRANQIMRQLVHGSTDEKKLATIMDELVHVKATLLLNVQAANVGVSRTIGEDLVANAAVIQRIDESLRKHIRNCEGLKIAQLLKDRRPSSKSGTSTPRVSLITTDDGLVPLTADDIKALGNDEDSNSDSEGSDSENSLEETLVDDSEASAHDSSTKTERIIVRNTTRNQALQINCAIGDDVWSWINRLVIEDNVAEHQSMQFNHGMSLEVALAFMDRQQANTGNSSKLEEKK